MADLAWRLAAPLLHRLDPERAHRLTIRGLASGFGPVDRSPPDPCLASRVWNLDVANPVGLAAGFDKHAEAPDAALRLGFGFAEAGTVTPEPQAGNPRPRLFRLREDEAVINRNGFNSQGLEPFVRRLAARRRSTGLVGANVGKNKDTVDEAADFTAGVRATAPFADYLVVNISSPNTPGLRDLQGRLAMTRLVTACLEARDATIADPARRPPLLVKLAPDLDEDGLADATKVALETGVDGLVMGNTTVSRPPGLAGPDRSEPGGLSGRPLFELATRRLAELYRLTEGRVPLIGCGGISSGADAYAKVRAGASLVQLYSALVFQGPGLVRAVKRDLAALLRRDGFSRIGEAVGADHR